MKKILTLKHWQIFLISCGIPFGISIIASILANSTGNFNLVAKTAPVSFLFFIVGFMSWIWAIGVNLYEKLPSAVKMNLKSFKVFVIVPSLYMLSIIFVLLLYALFNYNPGNLFPAALIIVLPLHLFSMYCMFYNIYFVAKILKAIQLKRNVKFDDFMGEFFMLWFFFLGIWVIQPRINQIFTSDNTQSELE